MGLFERILQRFVQSPAKDVQTLAPIEQKQKKGKIPALISGGVFRYQEYSDPTIAGQLSSYEGWVYACVTRIARSTAQKFDVLLYEKRNSGLKEIERHEVIDLLERPLPRLTKYDIIELTTIILELTGEAFWYKVRDERGKIKGIFPFLNPQYMTIVPGENSPVVGYVYSVPGTGQDIPFELDDIVYFNFPNPLNFSRGASPVKAIGLDIATEKEAKTYNWRFFKNNARPGGVLQTDQALSEDTYERLKTAWNNNHQGVENAGRVAVLEQGLQYTEIGLSQKDMEYLDQRKYSRDAIMALFGTPKSIFGLTEDVNRSNAETSKRVYLEETIEPIIVKLLSIINEQIVATDFADNLFFDYEDLTPEDQEITLSYYKSGLDQGWMTINEVRVLEGLQPIDGGDTPYIPFNKVPLGQELETPTAKTVKQRKMHISKKHTTEYDRIFEVTKKALLKDKAIKKIAKKKLGKVVVKGKVKKKEVLQNNQK